MLSALHKQTKKIGQAPGTPLYTGTIKPFTPQVTVVMYSKLSAHHASGATLDECLPQNTSDGITWINLQGLQNVKLVQQIAERYHLHPLTIEDILNVQQRPKIEEFDNYEFISIKIIGWDALKKRFLLEQLGLILGKDFVLSFQEGNTSIFNGIQAKLCDESNLTLRQQGSDYLTYRLIDTVVDNYFIVLEGIATEIDKLEDKIITDPKSKDTRVIYRLKRQLLFLRKSIWPMREVVSHLLQVEEKFISSFTRVYLRDLYDHVVQAIDTLETFRDMLSNLLDVYLSSVTSRMNEVMKTLTIIATIFMPATLVSSIYGMNFTYMPELHWHYGYFMALGVMIVIALVMLVYFWRKKWV